MRLAIIQNLYPNYINEFQQKNKEKINSYDSCLSNLHNDVFAWNGCWIDPLKEHDIEVIELYYNYNELNLYWIQENGLEDKNLTAIEILIAQLNFFKIDAILNTEVKNLNNDFLKLVKAKTKIKNFYAFICSPYFSKFDVEGYEMIFTCVHHYVELFKGYGKRAIYLPHAFNSKVIDILGEKKVTPKIEEIFFAGSVLKGEGLHDNREELLMAFIEKNMPLALYSDLYHYNELTEVLKSLTKKSIYVTNELLKRLGFNEHKINKIPILKKGVSWKQMPGGTVNKSLIKIAQKPLYGKVFYEKLQKYSASLNIHAAAAKNEVANMRLFEVTGIGTVLLTDYKDNLADFFEIDKEILSYKSIPEAVDKAQYLLKNPNVVLEMGKQAQKRVLKDHTYYNRAPIIANVLKKN